MTELVADGAVGADLDEDEALCLPLRLTDTVETAPVDVDIAPGSKVEDRSGISYSAEDSIAPDGEPPAVGPTTVARDGEEGEDVVFIETEFEGEELEAAGGTVGDTHLASRLLPEDLSSDDPWYDTSGAGKGTPRPSDEP